MQSENQYRSNNIVKRRRKVNKGQAMVEERRASREKLVHVCFVALK